MISIKFNDKQFLKDINNILGYTDGFMDGIQKGKPLFLNAMGARTVEGAKDFIDSYARVNPEILHHVYEWYKTGSPESRLFDISFRPYGNRIFFDNKFTQSQTIKSGSKVPFQNKAFVMENGQSLTIKPKNSTNLVFDVDGKTVFTPDPVTVTSPGGPGVVGGFEKTFDLFFNKYFSQSFLISSGILDYLSKPLAYKTNLRAGKTGGRSVGVSAGYRWIVNAGGKI
jgi:hypothetical protein